MAESTGGANDSFESMVLGEDFQVVLDGGGSYIFVKDTTLPSVGQLEDGLLLFLGADFKHQIVLAAPAIIMHKASTMSMVLSAYLVAKEGVLLLKGGTVFPCQVLLESGQKYMIVTEKTIVALKSTPNTRKEECQSTGVAAASADINLTNSLDESTSFSIPPTASSTPVHMEANGEITYTVTIPKPIETVANHSGASTLIGTGLHVPLSEVPSASVASTSSGRGCHGGGRLGGGHHYNGNGHHANGAGHRAHGGGHQTNGGGHHNNGGGHHDNGEGASRLWWRASRRQRRASR
jgi:hypothetical protein